MARGLLVMAAGVGLGVVGSVGAVGAWHGETHGAGKVVAARPMAEEIDGEEATATAVEVTLEPGQVVEPHRHPGPALGYVLEGECEWAIDDRPAKVLKAGEAFYEPGGCLHRLTRNPGKVKARLLAWVLHPRDAREIVIPVRK